MQDSNVSQTPEQVSVGNEQAQPQQQDQGSGKPITGMERLIKSVSYGPKAQTQVETKDEVKEEVKAPETELKEVLPDEEQKLPEGSEVKPPPFKKWEEMSQTELIEKVKKFQSTADKTKAEYDKLQKAIAERDAILQTIHNDPVSAFKQIAPELSDVLDIQQPIQSSLIRWQEAVLKPKLQQMFPNIVDEAWEPDPLEMVRPGTPSYEYFRQTNMKQTELENRQVMAAQQRENLERSNQMMEQTVIQSNLTDKQYLMETFGFTDEQMMDYARRFDEINAKTDPNDPYPVNHPYRVRNLMKAAFFDELTEIKVQKAVQEAVTKLHQEYKTKGISLPQKPMPVDVTNIKTQTTQLGRPEIRKDGTVMSRMMGRVK